MHAYTSGTLRTPLVYAYTFVYTCGARVHFCVHLCVHFCVHLWYTRHCDVEKIFEVFLGISFLLVNTNFFFFFLMLVTCLRTLHVNAEVYAWYLAYTSGACVHFWYLAYTSGVCVHFWCTLHYGVEKIFEVFLGYQFFFFFFFFNYYWCSWGYILMRVCQLHSAELIGCG